ncbi:lipopolysaccharide biosynthesis protein RfbH [Candidatus Woesearchaeota archaeon]|nr:lipopolysaccharide biosynthesis protein RfbH [Candidatus Woesearchaeota archaeon]
MKDEIIKKIIELVSEYYKAYLAESKFIAGESRIDPSGKMFDEEELKNGVMAVLDGWWTEGRFSAEFQAEFSKYLGVKHTILTNSGSSANLLAFHALTSKQLGERRIVPGDEVIAVASCFPTTVNPIVQYGCMPVFLDIMDINSGQYNIDCTLLENAITKKTKAIFLAHTLGNPFDIGKITEICRKNKLWLIEDCCDSLGSTYNGKKVGTFGDLATFSFYPAHHITMGEGGAIVTNSHLLKKLVTSFRNWGRDCWCDPGKDNTCGMRFGWELGKLPKGYDHKNIYSHMGFNLKPTDMQAAIGIAQLKKIDYFISKRKENFDFLSMHLKKYEDKIIMPKSLDESDPSWFGFIISVKEDAGFTREQLISHLTKHKVMTRSLFAGNITKQPSFSDVKYKTVGSLENTDKTMFSTFWIGVQPNITEEKRKYVADVFDSFFKELI